MISDAYYNRHWAETVRLFIGWLDEHERNAYIKEIGSKDILLAAECRANLFGEDNDLDEYLAMIAEEEAKEKIKTAISAKGLLALAVLEKYDKILGIFKSLRVGKSDFFYAKVIADFIRNGNEGQIVEFLKILASSNTNLLEKALDNILENAIVFSPDSKYKGLQILAALEHPSKEIVRLKLICLFQLRGEIGEPIEALYKLIRSRQIKYAYRLSTLAKMDVDETILQYLEDYVQIGNGSQLMKFFINLLSNLTLKFDRNLINIYLTRSLNPVVKRFSLSTLSGDMITEELALKLCKENILIGNKSSIEFADHMIDAFNLHKEISREDLVVVLLRSQKFQSIELAYNLIKRYSLYSLFNFRLLFNLLVGSIHPQSLSFAKKLVLEEFPIQEREDLLMYLAALSFIGDKPSKFTKQVLLNDLNSYDGNWNKEYIGYVGNYYKGSYNIYIGQSLNPINIPSSDVKLRVNDFITFRFEQVALPLETSTIKILRKGYLSERQREVWYRGNYRGQLLDIVIVRIERKFAVGKVEGSFNFYMLPISEIDDSYIHDISDYFKVNDIVRIRIKDFDRIRKRIICSVRELKVDSYKQFQDKLKLLKLKFSN